MSDKAVNVVYKIRRKCDGMFSMGGMTPHFSKTGKIWKQKGHLTNHLNQVDFNYMTQTNNSYEDCEIVLYEIVEKQIGEMTIASWRNEREEKLRKEEERRKELREENERIKRYREYLQLQKEFGEEK